MPLPNPEGWRAQPEPELMTLSEAVFQSHDGYVATRAFPNVPVMTLDGRFGRIDRGSVSRDDLAPRRPGSNTRVGTLETGSGNYSTEEYAEALPLTNEAKANASSSLPPEQAIMRTLVERAMHRREKRFTDAFFRMTDGTNNLWANNRTGVATGTPSAGTEVLRWDNDASKPIDDVYDALAIVKRNGGVRPNKMIISDAVFYHLARHPDILELITGGSDNQDPAHVLPMQLAKVFRLGEVIVGDASYNTAAQGIAASWSSFLGNHALLVHAPASPGIYVPSAGYHFTWAGGRSEMGMAMDGGGFGHTIDSWYDNDRKADLIRVSMRDDPKIVNNELGFFFNNIIS